MAFNGNQGKEQSLLTRRTLELKRAEEQQSIENSSCPLNVLEHDTKVARPSGLLSTPDTNKTLNVSDHAIHRVQEPAKHSPLLLLGGEKKIRGTSKSKTSLSRKIFVGCRIGCAKSKETYCYSGGLIGFYNKQSYILQIGLILGLFVVGSYQTSTVKVLYLISLIFAPPIYKFTMAKIS